MKSYFEWQTPAGFRPKKSAEALKKSLKPALFGVIFSICILGAIILLWFLLGIKPGSSFAAWYFIFALLAGVVLIFPPVSVFVWILFALRRPPRSGRKIKFTENKVVFGENRRGSWKYEDVQSFRIVEEEFRGTNILVLEMEHFDGDYLNLGITPDVATDRLRAVLSERLVDARKRAKNIFARKAGARLKLFAVLLMCCSLVAFVIFSGKFSNAKSVEKRDQKFARILAERMGELESEQVDKRQLVYFKKVTGWYLSTELLAKSNEMLIGMSISVSIFLIGCVLMLWGNNIYLKNKISRLQAYLPDKLENTGTKQESTA
ncbi:MAG: hypothetical protein ACYTDW_19960 [Planctomycetota bacterium]|jgi:hypothetical protein